MKITMNGNDIMINALELLERLPLDDKREFVQQAMLFDPELFTEFVKCLVSKEIAGTHWNSHIFEARLAMVKMLPGTMRNVADQLLREVDLQTSQADHYRSRAISLEQSWKCACPHCDGRIAGPESEKVWLPPQNSSSREQRINALLSKPIVAKEELP
jgi:hypothetical protein